MNIIEFQKLKEYKYDDEIDCEKGEYFLLGNNLIQQKENKKQGDEVTVFLLISKKKNSFLYIQKFIRLEKPDKK